MLGIGAIALLLSAVVILFGTSLPIFSKSTVEASFYNTVNLPLVIIISFLIGISLYTPWGMGDAVITLKKSLKAIAGALVGSALLWYFGLRDSMMLFFACAALFAVLVNGEVGLRIIRGDPRFLGGKLAHIGLALFFLGVISTGKYSSSKHISLPLNTPQEALGHTLTYVGYTPQANGKFAFNVVVEKAGKQFQLSPIMFEAGEQGIMRNPDIASFLTSDFYLSPVSLDQSTADAGHGHETYTIQKGQTVSIGDVQAKFVKFDMSQHGADAMVQSDGMAIGSVLELSNGTAKETVTPVAVYQPNHPPTYKPSSSRLVNATIQLVSMNVGMEAARSTITVEVQRPGISERQPETLVVEASIKPFINLVWGGTVVMMIGFVLSILKRSKEN
jgi:cytochrome c-type biogenesis protein CcmF